MNNVELIMYHYVRDLSNSRYPNIRGLDMTLFLQQLDFIQKHYNFVGMNDIIAAAYDGKRLPEHAVLLTFDDGYIDHYTNIFPVLHNRNIPAFFSMPGKIIREQKVLDVNKIHFILASSTTLQVKKEIIDKMDKYRNEYGILPNDELYEKYAVPNRFDDADTVFVKRILQNALPEEIRNIIVDELFRRFVTENEKAFANELYLNMEQIKTMRKNNMYFGIHGYEHYWFDKLTPQQYISDIAMALDVFEEVVDRSGWVFCYPYGATQPSLLEYCKSINCIAGMTTQPSIADMDIVDPLLIPRFDTNDYPPKSFRAVRKDVEK